MPFDKVVSSAVGDMSWLTLHAMLQGLEHKILNIGLKVNVAEVQNMARHAQRNALELWLSVQHLNRPCNSGEATKATGKLKWPTPRNVGIRYSCNRQGARYERGQPFISPYRSAVCPGLAILPYVPHQNYPHMTCMDQLSRHCLENTPNVRFGPKSKTQLAVRACMSERVATRCTGNHARNTFHQQNNKISLS
jgi:hypothetical protein